MLCSTPGKRISTTPDSYVVFDLETTGVSPRYDRIIEISAVRVENGSVTGEFSTLVNPGMPIPYAASMVNNIYDSMVCNAPDIAAVLPDFDRFIGDLVLVGHNIACFDMKFINRDAGELFGLSFGNDYVDTLTLARRKLPQLRHHTLADLAGHYGLVNENAHRALSDCRVNRSIYELLRSDSRAAAETGPSCPRCGAELKKRTSRFGPFWGCSSYPECRYTKNI